MKITLIVEHEKNHGTYTFDAQNWDEAKEKLIFDFETAQYIAEELEKGEDF